MPIHSSCSSTKNRIKNQKQQEKVNESRTAKLYLRMRDPVPAHCFHGHPVVLQLECLETLSHACGRQRRRPGSTNPPPPARYPPGLTTSSPRPRKRTERSSSNRRRRRRRVVERPQEDSGQRDKRRHRCASAMVKHGSETQDRQRGFADSNGSGGLQHSTALYSAVQYNTIQCLEEGPGSKTATWRLRGSASHLVRSQNF